MLRPSRNTPAPVTAAATVLPLKRPADARKAFGLRQDWQPDAWDYFDEVPELKQATWYLGNAMAKLRLFIAKVPDGDEEPSAADAEGSGIDARVVAQAKAELDRLRGGLGGAGEVLRELNMNFEIAGECFLIGWAPREEVRNPQTMELVSDAMPERWEIRSISEVEVTGSGKSQKIMVKDSPSDKGVKLNNDTDACIRLYQQHPRWSALADCAMRGVLGECEALVTLHRQVVAEANSRASAGFFTLPNELNLGGVPDTEGTEDGQEAKEDPFITDMSVALVEPIDDPSHPSATTPMLIRGPAEFLKPDYLRRIDLAREASKTLDERIEARVVRLARGLNLQVEVVMGHQNTTYANAEQVDQDQFDDHLQPRATLAVNALTTGFLRSQLRDETSPVANHPDVDRVMVWYDAVDLIAQPDKAGNALEDLKAGLISEEAARGARGWADEDAPTELERLQRAGLTRGILTADLTLALLNLLGEMIEVAPIPQAQAQPVGSDGELLPSPEAEETDAPADEGEAAAVAIRRAMRDGDHALAQTLIVAELGRRGVAPKAMALAASSTRRTRPTDLGRRLLELDRDLRTRLMVAADAELTRALDRAGARLRSKLPRSTKALTAQVARRDLPRQIGREAMAQLAVTPEDMLEGSFDGLEAQFKAWGASAQEQAIELASQTVAGFTGSERAALKLRQAADLDEAWNWLETHLRGFANDELFSPDPGDTLGEVVDGLAVPPGMLRQALAIAGGAILETTGVGGDAWTAVTANGDALGGIGTGDLLMGALRDHGAGVDGFVWVYGQAARRSPFEPHVQLDGVVFQNFDDPVLANTSGFPDLAFYIPGDHAGCICDFEPTIIVPEEA